MGSTDRPNEIRSKRDRRTDRQRGKYRLIYRQAGRQTDGQTDRQHSTHFWTYDNKQYVLHQLFFCSLPRPCPRQSYELLKWPRTHVGQNREDSTALIQKGRGIPASDISSMVGIYLWITMTVKKKWITMTVKKKWITMTVKRGHNSNNDNSTCNDNNRNKKIRKKE